jgi:regulator of protease activity HflC (stomatin/prohibitin superfamily)
MEYILAIIAFLLISVAALTIRRCVILEYQRGLLYNQGKFVSILEPGPHFYFSLYQMVKMVDIRTVTVTIPAQEVLSSDNVGIKISLAASYRVSDPYLVINKVFNYQETLYLLIQVNLRDIVGSLSVDDLLAKREEMGKLLFEKSRNQASENGVELFFVNIKDIMFPGELKNIFAQVVNARKEGLAALERARGESAALRNLANAAHALDNNPNLLQLRLIQSLEKSSGNTVVIMPPESGVISKLVDRSSGKTEE